MFSQIAPASLFAKARPALVVVARKPIEERLATGPGIGGLRYEVRLGIAVNTETREIDYAIPSGIAIDAETGRLLDEYYRSGVEEERLKGVLATLRVRPPDSRAPSC